MYENLYGMYGMSGYKSSICQSRFVTDKAYIFQKCIRSHTNIIQDITSLYYIPYKDHTNRRFVSRDLCMGCMGSLVIYEDLLVVTRHNLRLC